MNQGDKFELKVEVWTKSTYGRGHELLFNTAIEIPAEKFPELCELVMHVTKARLAETLGAKEA